MPKWCASNCVMIKKCPCSPSKICSRKSQPHPMCSIFCKDSHLSSVLGKVHQMAPHANPTPKPASTVNHSAVQLTLVIPGIGQTIGRKTFFFKVDAVLWKTARVSMKPKISPFSSDLSIQTWSRYCTSRQRDLEYKQNAPSPEDTCQWDPNLQPGHVRVPRPQQPSVVLQVCIPLWTASIFAHDPSAVHR